MLAVVIDDIGTIYRADAHAKARETWDLLLQRRLKREAGNNERFRLVTCYLGNGGNPLILARWLRALGSLGNDGNVKETCDLLAAISSDALFPGGNQRERFKVYQWEHKRLVPVPIGPHSQADRALYDEAIETLRGLHDYKRMRVVPEERWAQRYTSEDDIFGLGWTSSDI